MIKFNKYGILFILIYKYKIMKKKIIIYSFIWILFLSLYTIVEARAWWGWSSWWWGSGIAAIIWLIYYAIYTIRRKKMLKKAKKDLEEALKIDSSWNIEWLKKVTKEIFFEYQIARSEKNLHKVKNFMTKKYYDKAQQILNKKLRWKINIIKNISINDMSLISVRDGFWKDWDMFAMEIKASMIDYTIDEKTWVFIESTAPKWKNQNFKNYKEVAMNTDFPFTEYYIFIRCDWKWLLNNIKQKFSIIWDVIGLSEKNLRNILKQEQESDYVNDDMLYKD